MVAAPPLTDADVIVGADGVVAGVTLPDAVDVSDFPIAFTAVTVNEYP